MPQKITIRLKQYGDNGKMEDVGEILIPDGSPPIKEIKLTTHPDKFYRLSAVNIEFEPVNYNRLEG